MNDNSNPQPSSHSLEKPISYQIQNKTFIVEPVFPKDGKETLSAVLTRLMKTDISRS